jgi:uncharacterized membrane protein YdbT with pleckstrin-like domain
MSVIEKNLMAGEQIVYRGRLHWIIFLKAIFAGVVGLLAMIFLPPPSRWVVGWALLAAGISVAVSRLFTWYSSEFVVTNKRITMRTGFVRSHSIEILLTKVEALAVDQDILGRVLGYGSIHITGTGGTQERFDTIAAPFEFRKMTQEQIASVQESARR